MALSSDSEGSQLAKGVSRTSGVLLFIPASDCEN
jgi:hypothetical protein